MVVLKYHHDQQIRIMEQPQQSHDAIGSLVCFNRQSGHTRTSKQSHTRSTVQDIALSNGHPCTNK